MKIYFRHLAIYKFSRCDDPDFEDNLESYEDNARKLHITKGSFDSKYLEEFITIIQDDGNLDEFFAKMRTASIVFYPMANVPLGDLRELLNGQRPYIRAQDYTVIEGEIDEGVLALTKEDADQQLNEIIENNDREA